jgi:hypothetical protein
VTWLSKLLGGNECLWSAWFKSRYRYDKVEEMAGDLVEWNRQHNELMARRRRELEREGWTVTVEQQNDFKIEGRLAVVAGKPDIVAVKDGLALVVDGKTGRRRDADLWQVYFYLYALPKVKPALVGLMLEGEVQYAKGDERISLTPIELEGERMDRIVRLIEVVAGDTPPDKAPSRYECERCNIGSRDCQDRVTREREAVAVGEF